MTDAPTKDSNGNILADGDCVTLKRGAMVRNIRLTGDADEIEANVDRVRGLVLRTEFVKKA